MRHWPAIAALGAVSAAIAPAFAGKAYSVRTPSGREIYEPDQEFEAALDARSRDFVVEVAVGAGPEGNLGMLLGWINKPVRGIEYYVGFGTELNPARRYTAAVRYLANIDGYRPYLGLGYLYNDLYDLGSYSHNAFAEAGYSWVLHRTYHLTLGLGVRRILHTGVKDDSPLKSEIVDPELLDEQLRALAPWVPTLAVRFSRAF